MVLDLLNPNPLFSVESSHSHSYRHPTVSADFQKAEHGLARMCCPTLLPVLLFTSQSSGRTIYAAPSAVTAGHPAPKDLSVVHALAVNMKFRTDKLKSDASALGRHRPPRLSILNIMQLT